MSYADWIAVDWGTTHLRAWAMADDGRVLAAASSDAGMGSLTRDGFEPALLALAEGWLAPGRATLALACGMVGSRQGWVEAPYRPVPCVPLEPGGFASAPCGDGRLTVRVIPGIKQLSPADVMRGEETQLIGALALHPSLAETGSFILPGTHSKWAVVQGGAVTGFRTLMTGELFAVLRQHSMLGASGAEAADDAEAFARGVAAARDSGAAGALSRLFSARALMLDGTLAAGSVPDYLSGLLIGEEFRAALADGFARRDTPLYLVGDDALCERYRRAAALFGIELPPPIADAAAHGLWQLAIEADLVQRHPEESRAC